MALLGCVESGEGVPIPSGGEPKTFEDLQTMLFDPSCAASCHRGGAAPKGLSLQAGFSYKLLVGVQSSEVPSMMRVAPGLPSQSYLVTKVVSFDSRRKGKRMPYNGPPWGSRPHGRALRRWIKAGATLDWEDKGDVEDVLQVPFDGGMIDDGAPADGGAFADGSVLDAALAVTPDAAALDGTATDDSALDGQGSDIMATDVHGDGWSDDGEVTP